MLVSWYYKLCKYCGFTREASGFAITRLRLQNHSGNYQKSKKVIQQKDQHKNSRYYLSCNKHKLCSNGAGCKL